MYCRLPQVLIAGWLQLATSLVATPSAEHLAILEARHRQALHDGHSVEVDSHGEVDLQLRQDPDDQMAIRGIEGDTVYGSVMLLTVAPTKFAIDPAAKMAAEGGIEKLGEDLQLDLEDVSASTTWLEEFPLAVRVDFEVVFKNPKDRQAFTRSVAKDSGRTLVRRICARTPSPYRDRCIRPGLSELTSEDRQRFPLHLLGASSNEAAVAPQPDRQLRECAHCGVLFLEPKGLPQLFVEDQEWQESVAVAIASMAWVSRLQVGTLLAVVDGMVRVDFWLMRVKPIFAKGAIMRVEKAPDYIRGLANQQVAEWRWSSGRANESYAYGRLMLQVPDPQLFATNASVPKAVTRAVAQVAAAPGPEASKLSVTNASASVAVVGDVPNTVWVGFQVAFRTPRDRQVFASDFALDGGHKLAQRISEQLPSTCRGHCQLPGQHPGKVAPDTDSEGFGTFVLRAPDPQHLANDSVVQEAMALAISEMGSLPQEQVGILTAFGHTSKVTTYFWAASSNAKFRKAFVRRLLSGETGETGESPNTAFQRCTLAQLDRPRLRARSPDFEELAFGSIALRVRGAQSFANSSAVHGALSSAISQVASLPSKQVRVAIKSNLWEDSPDVVRVEFRVEPGLAGDVVRAIAANGGETLVKNVDALLRKPFKGMCRLPEGSGTEAIPALQPTLAYGTMFVYTFYPRLFTVRGGREAFATVLAEAASLPRRQVGVLMTLRSPALLRIDFWALSSNATLQQAAVERINKDWNAGHLRSVPRYMGISDMHRGALFMVSGGTVLGGVDRYKCK